MKIGDLVRYCEDKPRGRKLNPRDDLGIVTKTGNYTNGEPECHVMWLTCDNKGWWNAKNLEVISENR